MSRVLTTAIAAFTILVATLAACSKREDSAFRVEAWARATPPGMSVGGAYLTIHNPGAADRLIGVESSVSARAEIHQTSMVDGQMQMRELDALEIPAGGTVKFEPGGLHLMLLDLEQPLKEGDSIALTLQFERAGQIRLQARVEPLGATAPAGSSGSR